MATVVFFHAHPDDECITTGGTIAKLAAAGHRTVLVVATGGEHGEVPDNLAPGESLAARRRAETERSAAVLGVGVVRWLGYRDSGMMGWKENAHEESFWRADLDIAAARLATILTEERADVLTVYDWHGGYGHPDHIQVHRVGVRAAEQVGTLAVYEATMNRDHIVRLVEAARAMGTPLGGDDGEFDPNDTDDGTPFGTSEAELTTAIDVAEFLEAKRASIACHASQVSDTSFFLKLPPAAFAAAFSTEWFVRRGAPAGIHEHGLAGLP